MLGELKRYFRDSGWAVHVPRGVKERAVELARVSDELSSRLGRSPSLTELAEALDATEEQTLEAIEAYHARHAAPLEQGGDDDDSGPPSHLADAGGRRRAPRAGRVPERDRPGRGVAVGDRADDPLPALRPRHDAVADRRRGSGARRCRSRGCCEPRSRRSGARAAPRTDSASGRYPDLRPSTARCSWALFIFERPSTPYLPRLVVELVAGAALGAVGTRALPAALARGLVLHRGPRPRPRLSGSGLLLVDGPRGDLLRAALARDPGRAGSP